MTVELNFARKQARRYVTNIASDLAMLINESYIASVEEQATSPTWEYVAPRQPTRSELQSIADSVAERLASLEAVTLIGSGTEAEDAG